LDRSFPHKSSLLINDPVYGFTRIARGVLTDIVNHPLFQRLGRIRQLGLSSLVYPGAVHTRLQHSIGAYHLMSEALKTLAEKGVFIFDAEVEAAQAAILLHDIGHCAFSHVLERVFLPDVTHENITLQMIERMNKAFKGALTLAIELLSADCKKPFLHELICSQLDVDRLDYLCRDSFFTGVREGNIGAARIIRTLNVFDNHLVVEDKGLYSVENYLMSRRMMYWQVYLHKTVVAAEELLRSTLRRAQTLVRNGHKLFASPALSFFLTQDRPQEYADWLDHYAELDDSDIISAIKVWQHCDDKVLSLLAEGFINRHLFKVEVFDASVPPAMLDEWKERVATVLAIPLADADYFVTTRAVSKELYSEQDDKIEILYPDQTIKDVATVSRVISPDDNHRMQKTYLCHYRL
jgi:phosphohydrolase